jgi:hypothetical protein
MRRNGTRFPSFPKEGTIPSRRKIWRKAFWLAAEDQNETEVLHCKSFKKNFAIIL